MSAWAANLLYWKSRQIFGALIEAGEALRTSQRRLLAGREASPLREAMEARHAAVRDAIAKAVALADTAGVQVSGTMRQRLQGTLEAIATLGRSAPPEAFGRLTHDLTPPGLEALTGLAPEGGVKLARRSRPHDASPSQGPKPSRDEREAGRRPS